MLKVVHIDDSPAIVTSLSRLLGTVPDVELAGTAGDVASAVALIDAVSPDVVLLDVNLAEGRKGIEVLAHIRRAHPYAHVIVLTNVTSPALRQRYLDAGALGYFDKADEFRQACAWIAARASLRP